MTTRETINGIPVWHKSREPKAKERIGALTPKELNEMRSRLLAVLIAKEQ